jgi:hypothetical protein
MVLDEGFQVWKMLFRIEGDRLRVIVLGLERTVLVQEFRIWVYGSCGRVSLKKSDKAD